MLKVDTSNPVNHSDRYQAMFAGELACPSILGSNHVLCLILMAARHGEPYQVREPGEENTAAMKDEIAKVKTKQKTYSEAVGSQGVVSEPKFSQNSFQECFENFHSEKEEQSKRKCNLAIVNVPESTSTESAERIKEDIDLLTDIIKQELHLNVRVEKAIRVGKKKDDQPRVMIVTLKDEESKWEVLKESKALRESENEITKNMYINKDMTRQERERNRLLREELKARRANGENVKIVKGKCVVLKKAAQSEMRRTQEDAERTHSGTSSQV